MSSPLRAVLKSPGQGQLTRTSPASASRQVSTPRPPLSVSLPARPQMRSLPFSAEMLLAKREDLPREAWITKLNDWIARRESLQVPPESLDVILYSDLASHCWQKRDMEACLAAMHRLAEIVPALHRNRHNGDAVLEAYDPWVRLIRTGADEDMSAEARELKDATMATLYRAVARLSDDPAERAAAIEAEERQLIETTPGVPIPGICGGQEKCRQQQRRQAADEKPLLPFKVFPDEV